MKQLILCFAMLLVQSISSIAQKQQRTYDSLFMNGISLLKPNHSFKWKILTTDLMWKSFKGINIKKEVFGRYTHLKFDSAQFINKIWVEQVIVKYFKEKNDTSFNMFEFVGIVNNRSLEELTAIFNYNWKGWVFYPKVKPVYRFKLVKTNKGAALLVNSI